MHAAAPAVSEVATPRTQRVRSRAQRALSLAGAGAGTLDIAIDIVPVPHADREPRVETHGDVLPRERSELASRVLNVTVALLALICLSPLVALIAALVKLTSKGPVFYSQVRIGVDRRYRQASTYDRRGFDQGGRPFTMYKFRTMRTDAESNGQAVWAMKNDPRVTPIGNLLRATRLDELPQLWNVIRGDMNIVGPRPERPSIFVDLRERVPQYHLRQRVKPGITGWAQINQCYDTCVDDVRRKVQYDLEYMQRQGLLLDMRIMSMTLPVMVGRKGGW